MKQASKFYPGTIFLAVSISASVVLAAPFEVTDTDGQMATGELVAFDADRIILENEGKHLTFDPARVGSLRNVVGSPFPANDTAQNTGRSTESKTPISFFLKKQEEKNRDKASAEKTVRPFPESVCVLEFEDGSRLVAADIQIKSQTLTCQILNTQELTIPIDFIRSIRLDVKDIAAVATAPDDWRQLSLPPDKKSDRIVIGQPGTLDFYDGILANVDKETVAFIMDGETLPIPRRKVYGLIVYAQNGATNERSQNRPQRSVTGASSVLSLYDGSRLRVNCLALDDQGRFSWGNDWNDGQGLASTFLPEEIESIDLSRRNAVFLSDMKPARIEQSLLFDSVSDDSVTQIA